MVITGSASGMAKSATELLLSLGANVYAIDINPIDLPVKKAYQADLSKKEEIDGVIQDLPDQIDALFLCHGIAAFPGNELLVQKVNFYSQKYITEQLLSRIREHGSVLIFLLLVDSAGSKYIKLLWNLLIYQVGKKQCNGMKNIQI